jgi:hypothetical protein
MGLDWLKTAVRNGFQAFSHGVENAAPESVHFAMAKPAKG